MGRNSAQNQSRYRQKKKQDPEWRRKEVIRVQTYYKPTDTLSAKEVIKRREKGRKSMAKTRRKRKMQATISSNSKPVNEMANKRSSGPLTRSMREASDAASTSTLDMDESNCSLDEPGTSGFGQLKVKMPFRNNSRKRIDRSTSKLNRKNKSLSKKNSCLQRKVWTLEKQIQRASGSSPENCSFPLDKINTPQFTSTPLKNAVYLLKKSGISPRKAPMIRKALVLHNSIVKQVKGLGKGACKKLFLGTDMKRNRCKSLVAKSLNITRNVNKHKKQARQTRAELLRRRVQQFLMREDNATCMPGKRDTVKVEGTVMQKYILSDTVANLHSKFMQEHTNVVISLAQFSKYRPKNLKPVRFLQRMVCLCQKHQNLSLKLKAISNTQFPKMPDSFVQLYTTEQARNELQRSEKTEYRYREWKRTDEPYKNTTIKKTTLKEYTLQKSNFIDYFVDEMAVFAEHSRRVTVQYDEIRRLKTSLPAGHATIQMDFAENYVCNFAEEVQSAYYSKKQVTVHPAVIHYRSDQPCDVSSNANQHGDAPLNSDAALLHKSIAIVSNETAHTSGTVFAFLKRIVPKAVEIVPQLTTIHYLSDSPTSQYRNSNMFNIASLHQQMFGIKATWQYFEAGHGKGPCDGVGGAVKRNADLAVKKGVIIQTAEDLCTWGQKQLSSKVEYILVSKGEVGEANEEMQALGAIPVQGTMKVHSVMPVEDNSIYVRETSCFKPCCWKDGTFTPSCEGWIPKVTRKEDTETRTREATDGHNTGNDVEQTKTDTPVKTSEESSSRELSPHSTVGLSSGKDPQSLIILKAEPVEMEQKWEKGTFVAALYVNQPYIGKIVAYDPEDGEYSIKFMESSGRPSVRTYKWPKRDDELWIPGKDILERVDEPQATAKSERVFKLSDKDAKFIEQYY